MSAEPVDTSSVAALHERIAAAASQVVSGQPDALRLAFLALLCSGHVILEGVPGVAKTLIVRTLAKLLRVRFGRVQFTPDLMPSDVIGTPVLRPGSGEFEFRAGPLFTDLLLADEINRAPAKTQAALLEAMQERGVTVDGFRHDLGPHFTVFATQNPVEHEGTYNLPEAELDRFQFKIVVDYPGEEAERELLTRHHGGVPEPEIATVAGAPELDAARKLVDRVVVSPEIVGYVATLVRATRADALFALGASPRAGVALLRAAKGQAAIAGRDFALPEDVQSVWLPTLRHRIQLDPSAEVEGLLPDEALARALSSVAVPR
jgi:MoxR-like ATPase